MRRRVYQRTDHIWAPKHNFSKTRDLWPNLQVNDVVRNRVRLIQKHFQSSIELKKQRNWWKCKWINSNSLLNGPKTLKIFQRLFNGQISLRGYKHSSKYPIYLNDLYQIVLNKSQIRHQRVWKIDSKIYRLIFSSCRLNQRPTSFPHPSTFWWT